jgi:multidrug efflux pump subunit AcrA (membrane-fusion protein)
MANNKGNYVYVLDKNNKIQLRYVKLANVVNGRQFIFSGLNEGETVVTDGTNRVRPGDTAMPMVIGNKSQK